MAKWVNTPLGSVSKNEHTKLPLVACWIDDQCYIGARNHWVYLRVYPYMFAFLCLGWRGVYGTPPFTFILGGNPIHLIYCVTQWKSFHGVYPMRQLLLLLQRVELGHRSLMSFLYPVMETRSRLTSVKVLIRYLGFCSWNIKPSTFPCSLIVKLSSRTFCMTVFKS